MKMSIVEFAEKYLEGTGMKLLPWQKNLLECMERGENVYVSGGRSLHNRLAMENIYRAWERDNKMQENAEKFLNGEHFEGLPKGKVAILGGYAGTGIQRAILDDMMLRYPLTEGKSYEDMMNEEIEKTKADQLANSFKETFPQVEYMMKRRAINSSIQGSSMEQEPVWDTGIVMNPSEIHVGVDVGEPGGDKTAVTRMKVKDGKAEVISLDLYDEEESRG
jgi:hypothetical protein